MQVILQAAGNNSNLGIDAVNDQVACDQADVNRNSNFQEFDADMIESPLVSFQPENSRR